MELEVIKNSSSPIKTIEKEVKIKTYFTINNLTSSLQLTTDQIFKLFKNNNDDIVQELIKKNKNIIEKDTNCRCFSMKSKKMNYSRKCKGCQIISRLIKTDFLETSKIEIYSGRYKNNFLQINSYPYQQSNYELDTSSLSLLNYCSKNLKNIENYQDNVSFYKNSDKVYNFIINSIFYNILLKKEKLYLYNNFMWSFICSNYTTTITRKSIYKNTKDLCRNPYYSNYSSPYLDINKETKISKNTLSSIIKQLVYLSMTLSKYHFVHGEPCSKYINYSNEKTVIMGETHTLKLILNLSNFSSITYENKRYFYNDERIFNSGIPLEKIEVSINGSVNYTNHSKVNDEYDKLCILFYKIGNKVSNFIKLRNNCSVPLCYRSFDFICFLVSLINDPVFYKTFLESDKFLNIWKLLWKKDEYQNLMEEITRTKFKNFTCILNILKKYFIRFDAIDYFYNEVYIISSGAGGSKP